MTTMDAVYIINMKINNMQVPTLINSNENYSIITTGLLEDLNLKCNNVKFSQKQLSISGRNAQTLGKIRKFEMVLEFFLLHHDVYIINDEVPLLLLGKDWTTEYNVIYDTTHMWLEDIWIPIVQTKEGNKQDPMELVNLEDEELILDEELDSEYLETYSDDIITPFNENLSNHSHETDGLLIDLTTSSEEESQGNTILPMNRDILELDAQIFQQDFNGMLPTSPIPMPPDIMSEPIEEKAIRRLKNTSSQKKIKKQSNKKLSTKETNNQHKCYLCKCKGHTMKDCKLEPIFRNHEQNCKRYGIHVWKS
jgi:hypothetical protein